MLRHLDLFSGLGGFSLGLEATGGFETVAFCDIEKFSRKVLKKHWPNVKQYKDIKELTYEQIKEDTLAPIDIITGGYPCQPFSVAGSQRGEKDKRHLWPEMFRLVKECKPTWVIGENVSGHIKLGLDTVLQDLESEGYSVRAFSISASSIGANHQRERVWIIAHSERNGLLTSEERRSFEETISKQQERQNNAFNLERTSGLPFSSENVEDTRQHGGGIEPSGNTESIGRGSLEKTEWTTNADQTSGSGEGEEITTSEVANTNSERGRSWETRREDAENVGQSSRRPWDGWMSAAIVQKWHKEQKFNDRSQRS